MRGAVEELIEKMKVMRDSIALPTQVVLERTPVELLPVVCDAAAQRCTGLVIGLRGESCSEEVAVGGCKIMETALAEVLSVVQVVMRDRAAEKTLLKRLQQQTNKVFDATVHLLQVLQNKEQAQLVSPGTGLVWSVLAELGAVPLSSNAQLKRVLENAESAVLDTIEEMSHLPTREQDKHEGLTAKELTRAARAIMALKAARGVFKYCAKSLQNRAEQDGAAAEALIGAAENVSRAVEDAGCCLYAPQDLDELLPALEELSSAVSSLCDALTAVDTSPEAQKMQSVALALCKNAVDKIRSGK
jgi:hypothetical protein